MVASMSTSIERADFPRLQQELSILLNLQRQPVAVRFLQTRESVQGCSTSFPQGGLPYCTAVSHATRGKRYKLDAEHSRCAAASIALGMAQATEYRTSGRQHWEFGVYRSLDVSKNVMDNMVLCSEQNCGVELGPLADTDVPPDILILILNPKAAMRAIQGYAYHFGQLTEIKMAGMCALCQECTSYPHQTQRANVSLLCSGTRCVGRWQEDELAVGIPFGLVAAMVDGIKSTVNPMETDNAKRELEQRMTQGGLPDLLSVQYRCSYYRHAYRLPGQRT